MAPWECGLALLTSLEIRWVFPSESGWKIGFSVFKLQNLKVQILGFYVFFFVVQFIIQIIFNFIF